MSKEIHCDCCKRGTPELQMLEIQSIRYKRGWYDWVQADLCDDCMRNIKLATRGALNPAPTCGQAFCTHGQEA